MSDRVCYTCDEAYTKVPTQRAAFCSNPFHCCRDCVWELGHEGGFSTMKLTTRCDDHSKPEGRTGEGA